MKRILVVLFWVLFFCAPLLMTGGAVKASVMDSGGPWISGSWAQRFQEDGWYNGTHYDFDKIEVFMMSGATNWESPGMSNFSVAGWSGNTLNPNYTISTGPATGYMQWDFLFTGTTATPFVFDYLAYKGTDLLGITQVNWGPGWSYANSQGREYDRTEVPEPATMLLLGSGIIGLAGFAKRKFKKK